MRILLKIMLLTIAGSSFYASLRMMQDPTGQLSGLDPALLASTPFTDFFLPGLLMNIFISIPSLASFVLIFAKKTGAYRQSMMSGALLMTWILIQLIVVPGYWGLSILYLLLGLLTLLISLQLRGKQAL